MRVQDLNGNSTVGKIRSTTLRPKSSNISITFLLSAFVPIRKDSDLETNDPKPGILFMMKFSPPKGKSKDDVHWNADWWEFYPLIEHPHKYVYSVWCSNSRYLIQIVDIDQ